MALNTPVRSVSTTSCHCSSVMSATVVSERTPALASRMSTLPSSDTARWTAAVDLRRVADVGGDRDAPLVELLDHAGGLVEVGLRCPWCAGWCRAGGRCRRRRCLRPPSRRPARASGPGSSPRLSRKRPCRRNVPWVWSRLLVAELARIVARRRRSVVSPGGVNQRTWLSLAGPLDRGTPRGGGTCAAVDPERSGAAAR